MIRQKKDEAVKSYAEWALLVSQNFETDERYLVCCFMAGPRVASMQTALTAKYKDLNVAPMRELHRTISSIVRARHQHGDDNNDNNSPYTTTRDANGSGDEVRIKPSSSKVLSGELLKDLYSIIEDLEECLRKIEPNAPYVEVLVVSTGQDIAWN